MQALIYLWIGFLLAASFLNNYGFQVQKDYYPDAAGGRQKMLVVDYGGTDELKPACICIHGGGWIGGNAGSIQPVARLMAKQGFRVFNIEYRLIGEARWPAQIDDCRAAVSYVKSNRGRYRIYPDRMLAIGHSAGGHLACMLGTADPVVQAVVNLAGPERLSGYSESEVRKIVSAENLANLDKIFAMMVRFPEKELLPQLREMSPYEYVSSSACPHLNIHGTGDDIVPWQPGREYHEKLLENGVYSRLVLLKGDGHGFEKHPVQLQKEVMRFSESFIKGTGPFRDEQKNNK